MVDAASLRAAMSNVDAVFSMQPGRGADPAYTPETEVAYGIAVADAAAACGVAHLVQMSVAGAERDTGVGFWESKRRIELHVQSRRIPATVLRPAAFMENLSSPNVSLTPGGVLLMSDAETRWQFIAGDDIGMIAAEAFDHPSEFVGRAIDIAGDDLSAREVAFKMSRAVGRHIPLMAPSNEMRARSPALRRAHDFIARDDAWAADVGALRHRFPGLRSLDDWLAADGALQIRAALSRMHPTGSKRAEHD